MKNSSKYLWSASKTIWIIISSFVTVFIIGLVIVVLIKSGEVESLVKKAAPTEIEGKILFWVCSMDSQIKQDGPGRCPICGMDLVPMREDAGGGEKASLRLSERARHLASVNTTQVNYKKLFKSIYTVGKIDYDEGRVAYVTAWVSGRVDKLYVNFTGSIVKKGEHLIYLYCPDLLSAQDEYLLAYLGIEQLKQSPLPGAFAQIPLPGAIAQSPLPGVIASSRSLLESARRRLLLWGITVEQIEELERTQKPQIHLTIYAPIGGTIIDKKAFKGLYFKTGDRLFTIADLSRVWLYLDIYEYDIPWIRYGQDVEVITESHPGEVFHGTVVLIDPFLDEMTRTVKVRINMDNKEGKLKPGMYVNARFKASLGSEGIIFESSIKGRYMCPMHPDVISDKQDNCPECGMKPEPVGGRKEEHVLDLIPPQYECPMQCEGSASDVPGYCSMCWKKLIRKEDSEEPEPVGGKKEEYVPGLLPPQYECPVQCEGPASDAPGYCSMCWKKLIRKEDSEEPEPVGERMEESVPVLLLPQYECPVQCEGPVSDVQGYCSICWRKLIRKEDSEELEPVGGKMSVFAPGLIPHTYECPMNCEDSGSDKPGNCPMCKMVLIRKEGEKTPGENVIYVCSEHIDEQAGLPGKCPTCQRKLEEKRRNELGVLAVPHSAVLLTGKRNIVYVEKEEGYYVPRDIVLGPKADEYYPVISGLNVGEKVVASGSFLIDSQMQLLGKPSLLFPEGSAIEEAAMEKKNDTSATRHEHEGRATEMIESPQLRQTMEEALNNYYAIASKLANDSTEYIDKHLDIVAENSQKIRDMGVNISEDTFKRLSGITNKIEDNAARMKGMELEEARKIFMDLSQAMISFLKEFRGKIKDAGKVYVYYCPMVDASWLQDKEGTLNPYYGPKMLKCGSIKEKLP